MTTLCFKTPDVLQALKDKIEEYEEECTELDDGEEEHFEAYKAAELELAKARKELEFIEKYVEYGECLQVEFDAEKQTVRVLK